MNAYTQPPVRAPGCQHLMGCKCTPPLWLRPSTPDEQAFEKRFFPVQEAQNG